MRHAESSDLSCTFYCRDTMMAQIQTQKSLFSILHIIRNLNQSHCGCSHLYSLPSESVGFLPFVLHLRE